LAGNRTGWVGVGAQILLFCAAFAIKLYALQVG
jgi:hypothetical protein